MPDKKCMYCMFDRFLSNTRKKIQEETISGIKNALLRREATQVMELEHLGKCTCGEEIHKDFAPRFDLNK